MSMDRHVSHTCRLAYHHLRSIAKIRNSLTTTACKAIVGPTKAAYTLAILPDARTVRERFASGCPCTHCVHCVGFVRYTQTTSGCVRSGRERFASACLCIVNDRVDASGASGREDAAFAHVCRLT